MDGPGLHYIRRSYRKQAASVAQGNLNMLTRQSPEAVQVLQPSLLPQHTSAPQSSFLNTSTESRGISGLV